MTMQRLDCELRSAELDGNTLKGVAHVTGQRAKVGGQYEEFSATAFDEVLNRSDTDVRAFYNHNTDMLLGRQSNGTLKLSMEEGGLAFSIDLPNTSYGNDIRELVKRGDLNQASFGFLPGKFDLGRAPDGLQVRRHTSVRELIDVSPVPLPAFSGTSVELRSRQDAESVGSQLVRARARVAFNREK